MFLVPYLIRTLPNEIQQVWLFLERNGTHLMETESVEAAVAFATANGLGAGATKQEGDLLFLQVSAAEPGLSEFYAWRDIVPGTLPLKEVWRPFLWSMNPELGVNAPLQEIKLAPGHTVLSVLSNASHLKL